MAKGIEILSDHLYIFMEVKDALGPGTEIAGNRHDPPRQSRARPLIRWKIKERDTDLLRAVTTVTV